MQFEIHAFNGNETLPPPRCCAHACQWRFAVTFSALLLSPDSFLLPIQMARVLQQSLFCSHAWVLNSCCANCTVIFMIYFSLRMDWMDGWSRWTAGLVNIQQYTAWFVQFITP
ncbi:hypothetical protein ABZP36_025161 [Zizania latifolia]